MATEPVVAKKFATLIIFTAAVGMASVYAFRSELSEAFLDAFSSNSLAIKRTATAAELPDNPVLLLRPSQNDIEFVRVSGLKAGPATAAGNSVGFTLTNTGDNNGFPSIRLYLTNRMGKAIREIVLSPADYQHPDRFEQFDVQLMVQLQPGETSFTVKPFYQE